MEPTIPDRVLWTILVAASATAAAVIAERALAWAWRRVRNEDPPATIGIVEGLTHRATRPALHWLH